MGKKTEPIFILMMGGWSILCLHIDDGGWSTPRFRRNLKSVEGVAGIDGITPPAFPSFLHYLLIIDSTDDKEIVEHTPFSSCK